MKHSPLLFILASFCLACAGLAALTFGTLGGTEEETAGIAIVGVLAVAVLGYGIIRWREDGNASTY